MYRARCLPSRATRRRRVGPFRRPRHCSWPSAGATPGLLSSSHRTKRSRSYRPRRTPRRRRSGSASARIRRRRRHHRPPDYRHQPLAGAEPGHPASLGPGSEVVAGANVIDVADEVEQQGPSTCSLPAPSSTVARAWPGWRLCGRPEQLPPLCWPLDQSPRPTSATSSGLAPSTSSNTRTASASWRPRCTPRLRHCRRLGLEWRSDAAGGRARRRCRACPVRRGLHRGVVQRWLRQDLLRHQLSLLPGGTDWTAPVCLVDLDLQFGEVSTALHLRPRFTISDLLPREPVDEDDLDEHVEEYLEEHELGFSVLAAPFSPPMLT